MNGRSMTIEEHRFGFCRETLARDGGNPPGQWFVMRLDPKQGNCVDRTVPDGYFETMREARAALLAMYQEVKS